MPRGSGTSLGEWHEAAFVGGQNGWCQGLGGRLHQALRDPEKALCSMAVRLFHCHVPTALPPCGYMSLALMDSGIFLICFDTLFPLYRQNAMISKNIFPRILYFIHP